MTKRESGYLGNKNLDLIPESAVIRSDTPVDSNCVSEHL